MKNDAIDINRDEDKTVEGIHETYLPLLLQLMLYNVDTNVREVVINSFNRSATAFLSALSTLVCLICFNRDVCKFNKLKKE